MERKRIRFCLVLFLYVFSSGGVVLTGGSHFEKSISWYVVFRGRGEQMFENHIILGPSPYICSVLKSIHFFSKRKKFKSNICSAVWGGPVDTLPGSDYVKKFHRRFAQFHYKYSCKTTMKKVGQILKKVLTDFSL